MPKQLMQVSSLSLCFRSTSLRRQVLDSLLNRIVYSPSSTSLSVPSSQQPRGRANFAPYASAPSSAPSSTPSLPAQPSLDTSTAAQWEQVLARAAAETRPRSSSQVGCISCAEQIADDAMTREPTEWGAKAAKPSHSAGTVPCSVRVTLAD